MIANPPNHLLIIPDGNRRYAIENGISLDESYKKAAEKATKCLEWIFTDFKIPVFSAYGISLDNVMRRSETQLTPIYNIQVESYKNWLESGLLKKNSIKVNFIGEVHLLPNFYQEVMRKIEKCTKKHKKYQLFILAAYSGKLEIMRAVKRFANEKNVLKNSLFDTMDKFYKYLEIKIPVDCIIRTANEKRISDSLIYQSSYAEFCSIPKYFPSMTKSDLEKVLLQYSQRKRRFGE